MTDMALIPWSAVRARMWGLGFYLLVLLAGLSYPILEYQGDAVTVFDVYLVLYVAAKLMSSGFSVGKSHWRDLGVVYAVYLAYLAISSLRVATPFSLLLLAKQTEHLVFLFVLADWFHDSENTVRDVRGVIWVLAIIIGYQLLYNHGLVGGIGQTYRLGLPFKSGVSPNPAGFFLAATLLFVYHCGLPDRRLRLPSAILGLLAIYALVLTVSRTNILALMLVLTVSIVVSIWNSRFRWPLLLAGVVLAVLFFTVLAERLPEVGPTGRIVRILKDPLSILGDSSFNARTEVLWPQGFSGWHRSAFAVLFGSGPGYFDVVDGTLPRVLGEQGLIGLTLFAYVWVFHYLVAIRRKAVVMLLLLALMNAVTVETLVISYRTIQLYLVILVMTVSMVRQQSNNKEISANVG